MVCKKFFNDSYLLQQEFLIHQQRVMRPRSHRSFPHAKALSCLHPGHGRENPWSIGVGFALRPLVWGLGEGSAGRSASRCCASPSRVVCVLVGNKVGICFKAAVVMVCGCGGQREAAGAGGGDLFWVLLVLWRGMGVRESGVWALQGRAMPGKAKEGSVRQGKAEEGMVKQGKAKEGRVRQGKAEEDKAKQSKARQSKALLSHTYFLSPVLAMPYGLSIKLPSF